MLASFVKLDKIVVLNASFPLIEPVVKFVVEIMLVQPRVICKIANDKLFQ